MRALLDVNLLIALLQPDHVHFERAHQWWDANREHGWASCPLTQNGFIRILSQSTYERPMPISHALDALAERTLHTDHAFWPDDVSLLDTTVFERSRMLGPRQLTDIYLLGLAVRNDGRLATLDRTVSTGAVRGAQAQHLIIV